MSEKATLLRPFVRGQNVRAQISGHHQKWWYGVVDSNPLLDKSFPVHELVLDADGQEKHIRRPAKVWLIPLSVYRTADDRDKGLHGKSIPRRFALYPNGESVFSEQYTIRADTE